MSNLCESCAHEATAHSGDRKECTSLVTDEYGQWKCCCPVFERDPDE